MLTDKSFAERIIEKYRNFGRYPLYGPTLVFVRDKKDTYMHQTNQNVWMELQFSLPDDSRYREQAKRAQRELVKMVVQDIRVKNVRGEWEAGLARELSTMRKTVDTFRKQTQILKLMETAVIGPVWKQPQLIGQVRTLAGWETAHRLEQYYRERDAAVLPWSEDGRYVQRTKRQSFWYQETGERLFRQQVHQKEELVQTNSRISHLEERLTTQEQIIREIKQLKQTTSQLQSLRPEQIDGITKAVVKNMERELRLEKLRRGLY